MEDIKDLSVTIEEFRSFAKEILGRFVGKIEKLTLRWSRRNESYNVKYYVRYEKKNERGR